MFSWDKARGVPRLGPEAGQGFGLPGVSGVQQLDGHRPGARAASVARHTSLNPPAPSCSSSTITAGEEVSGEDHQSVVTLIGGL